MENEKELDINYDKCWHRLNIDTSNALNPNFSKEKLLEESPSKNDSGIMWCFTDASMYSVLNEEWVKHLNSQGIRLTELVIFYRKANYIHPQAHIDLSVTQTHVLYGLNFVISEPDDDSFMTWYDVENSTGTFETTNIGTKYTFWKMEDVQDKEFDRLSIGKQLTLVRTDKAHNVITGNTPRWAISLRNASFQDNSTWKDVVDYYAKHIQK